MELKESDLMNGTASLLAVAWQHLRHPQRAIAEPELFQSSIMRALLQGVYEGSMTYAALAQHGDFGLGTFNDLDGEMVAFEGRFHQLRSDGSASTVNPEQKTPFAIVTFFRPEREIDLTPEVGPTEIAHMIQEVSENNLFTAVKIQGTFRSVQTRTVRLQTKPFPPLTEAAAHEVTREFLSAEGTLAGFRTPEFAQGIGVAGLHLHFLNRAQDAGGHAFSYVLDHGTMQLMHLRKFHLELPTDKEFLDATFPNSSADEQIQAAEGGRTAKTKYK